jgi:hypothetical protein
MSYTQPSNSCPEVEVAPSPSQSASMSTSSQYYRSANPHSHSHYQNFPSNAHEQAYANYLGAWQDSSPTSYTGPSSVPLAHYPHAGLGSDFDRTQVQQPLAPQAWNASYAQPNVQQWNAAAADCVNVNEQTFAPRLAGGSYDIVEGGASVQHRAPNIARPYPHQHHQQAVTAQQQQQQQQHEQPLTSPDPSYRDTDRFSALRITSVSASMAHRTLTLD